MCDFDLMSEEGKIHTFVCGKCVVEKVHLLTSAPVSMGAYPNMTINSINDMLSEFIISEAYKSCVLTLYTAFGIFDDIYPILNGLKESDYPERIYHILMQLSWYYMAKKEVDMITSLASMFDSLIHTIKTRAIHRPHRAPYHISHGHQIVHPYTQVDNNYEWDDSFLEEPIVDNDYYQLDNSPFEYDDSNRQFEYDTNEQFGDISPAMLELGKEEDLIMPDEFELEDIGPINEEVKMEDIGPIIEEQEAIPQQYYIDEALNDLTPEELAFIYSY